MPITRRKRATPPEQPEDNNHSSVQPENIQETLATEQAPIAPLDGERVDAPLNEQSGNAHTSPNSSQSQHQAGKLPRANDDGPDLPHSKTPAAAARARLRRRVVRAAEHVLRRVSERRSSS